MKRAHWKGQRKDDHRFKVIFTSIENIELTWGRTDFSLERIKRINKETQGAGERAACLRPGTPARGKAPAPMSCPPTSPVARARVQTHNNT